MINLYRGTLVTAIVLNIAQIFKVMLFSVNSQPEKVIPIILLIFCTAGLFETFKKKSTTIKL